tara:strand:+ start:4241 stop:5614 length:1374 start_codon:yes stop_codon:yes gene_type:complete
MSLESKYEQYAKTATVKPKKVERQRYSEEDLQPQNVGGVWRDTPEKVGDALHHMAQQVANESAQRLQDLQRSRAWAMAGRPYEALGQSGDYVGGTWYQAPAQIPFWGDDNYLGTGTQFTGGGWDAIEEAFRAAVQKAGGPQYAPNDPRRMEEAPSAPGDKKGPWQTGQFKSYEEPQDPLDKKFELVRDSISSSAERRIDDIKSMLGYGLEEISRQEKALLAGTASSQEWANDLYEINKLDREANETAISDGFEGDVDQSNNTLVELGVQNPTVYTDKPKNSTEALLQGVYNSSAQTINELRASRSWFDSKLDEINRTGLSREKSRLIQDTSQMIQGVEQSLADDLLELDVMLLEKEISEEEAATASAQRLQAAEAIAEELNTRADFVLAAWDADVLKSYATNVWEPDNTYWPAEVLLQDPAFAGQMLPLDVIKELQNIKIANDKAEREAFKFTEQYG